MKTNLPKWEEGINIKLQLSYFLSSHIPPTVDRMKQTIVRSSIYVFVAAKLDPYQK